MKKFFLILMLLIPVTTLYAGRSSTLLVEIGNIESSEGNIRIGVYNTAKNFDDPEAKPFRWKDVNAKKGTVKVKFTNIPYGNYAVAVFQDENKNKKLDKNLFGMPTEPYGFSKNFTSKMRKPDFKEIAFQVNADLVKCKVEID
jgi:uncharacterized protein (DUF2141 family)